MKPILCWPIPRRRWSPVAPPPWRRRCLTCHRWCATRQPFRDLRVGGSSMFSSAITSAWSTLWLGARLCQNFSPTVSACPILLMNFPKFCQANLLATLCCVVMRTCVPFWAMPSRPKTPLASWCRCCAGAPLAVFELVVACYTIQAQTTCGGLSLYDFKKNVVCKGVGS